MKARTVERLHGLIDELDQLREAMDPVNPEIPVPYSIVEEVVDRLYYLVEVLVVDPEGAP